MSDKLKALEREARALPSEDRARLAEILLGTLRETPSADVETEWNREIGERVAAYDRRSTSAVRDRLSEKRRWTSMLARRYTDQATQHGHARPTQ